MKKLFITLVLLQVILYHAYAQLPSGSIASYYFISNTATDYGGSSYNGSLTSTSAVTNRFGTAANAISFTAGSSTGSLPSGLVTALQDNFSIGYWFKSSMTANGNSTDHWYIGNAMVDAEVCGGVRDWGTALINGGQVCFGIGAPDITIRSSGLYNDGNWHFATAVRDQTAGSITLYVDGSQVASTTGTTTNSLNSPSFIGLARNPCNSSAVFTGVLDDLIAYNRVLSSTEVSNLYGYLAAFTLPVKWVYFTGDDGSNGIKLKWGIDQSGSNDHFDVEHSTDGTHFSVIGTVTGNTGVASGSGLHYSFSDNFPSKNIHYYRIRQVDRDGQYSYSGTIRINFLTPAAGMYIKTNPVQDAIILVNSDQLPVRQLEITDMNGRVMKQQYLNSASAVITSDVQSLPGGFYTIRVKDGSGNSYTLPFIRQ
ncbi:MAG TPA: LamG-like jellyroll fold domain-containing protein [Chitinophagaceae bacterium]|nr:LamG-like jellyroll fold domain-containing protein [Chitinophagaceae bacterium]